MGIAKYVRPATSVIVIIVLATNTCYMYIQEAYYRPDGVGLQQKKFESVNAATRVILKEYYEFLESKDHKYVRSSVRINTDISFILVIKIRLI